ncbi:hypothetical protein K438DRAFT_1924921 [Mycena galopus ATCC 62051]|nr:hypothetical protein K438DRAFT_1924921 [Mycena galopus ATCC 62051]
MADSLPDEIISEILSPALKVPEHMFSNLAPKSPFAKYSVSSSAALLVCKAWLRVSTPLLYHVVVIRSKAQCRALCDALKNSPDLGRFIKKLRVEGGFSTPMHEILKRAPNITDLFLSLQIHSSDSSSGLATGLSLINPTRLIIFDDGHSLLKNKAVLLLIASLEACGKKWTNLCQNTLLLPYASVPAARESFVLAMCTFAGLKIVSIPAYYYNSPFLIQLAAISTLEAIEIREKPPLKPKEKFRAPPKSSDPELSSLLRWAEDLDAPRTKRIYKISVRRATDPTFQPLASVPQPVADKIWGRILFFTMLPLEPRPKVKNVATKAKERLATTKRLRFLSVSKLFHRLGLPYLYREPVLSQSSLPKLAESLSINRALGTHISELDIRSSWAGVLDIAAILPRILEHTPRLRRLIGNGGSVRLTYAGLCTLGETAGARLEELSGVSFIQSSHDAHRSPAVLTHFTALRILAWHGASNYTQPPFFTSAATDADTIPTDALPALEFLTLKSTDALPAFSQMKLQALRRVSIHTRDTTSRVTDFLGTHGTKILTLRTPKPVLAGVPLLTLCPNVTTFACCVDDSSDFDLGASTMDTGFKHTLLTTLIVNRAAPINSRAAREDLAWAEVFPGLEAALEHLPALSQIRSLACQWPTTEHAIGKSVWVQAAERLMKRGVKLTDKSGVEWHPRLKATRR